MSECVIVDTFSNIVYQLACENHQNHILEFLVFLAIQCLCGEVSELVEGARLETV